MELKDLDKRFANHLGEFSFLIYRVELKVVSTSSPVFLSLYVPNLPCGVESRAYFGDDVDIILECS